jgi:stress-induced-phosphoprotein 1
MNPVWPRGYQRKGSALFYLDRIDDAINVYKEGLKVDPNNADLQKDLKAAEGKKNEGASPQMNQAYLSALLKLMQHPETKDLFQDPTFMQKLQAIMANPQLAQVYMQQDPRMQKVFEVLSQDTSPDDLENLTKQF